MAENSWFDWRQAVVAVIRDDFSDVLEEVAENDVDWEARRRFMRRGIRRPPTQRPARHQTLELRIPLQRMLGDSDGISLIGELRHSYGVGNVGR